MASSCLRGWGLSVGMEALGRDGGSQGREAVEGGRLKSSTGLEVWRPSEAEEAPGTMAAL